VVSQLANAVQKTPQSWATSAPIVLVAAPVVEATRTTRFRFHSGVPRVVRTVAPIWSDENDLVLAVMDRRAGVLREPTQFEFDHVMRWADDLPNEPPAVEPTPTAILVPWRTTVIIPEITGMPPRPEYLAAMGRDSGNELAVLLYDLIPYTVPELVNPRMTARFSNLISVIRTSRRISAISESVAQDFLGLSRSFASQGIEPPTVRAHPLPIHAHAVSPEVQADCERRLIGVPGLPLVLSVSSLEPRKNQTTVLLAAERLWRDGLAFQLVFIAANSWMNDTFDEVLAELLARGRPIRIINQASEDLLWSAYRVARFTVFVPFAEGFGLPAAESIAAGTPVVLSNHGSMAEIGRYGGAAMVSPYDLGQVSDAMRRLLTDDTYLAELEEQAQARTTGNWETYARSTWDWLARGLD
ncbi:MAG: glycosyltransferase, partial [Actinomycetes bacterium]